MPMMEPIKIKNKSKEIFQSLSIRRDIRKYYTYGELDPANYDPEGEGDSCCSWLFSCLC